MLDKLKRFLPVRMALNCSGRCGQAARRRRAGRPEFRPAVIDGRKRCTTCDTWKPIEEFSRRRDRNQAPLTGCKPCQAAARRAYSRTDAGRNAQYARKYGVTLAWFNATLRTQGGKCAICLDPFGDAMPRVDHCHSSGKARGLLCEQCNQGLGRFRDDPVILRRAARYAVRHRRG